MGLRVAPRSVARRAGVVTVGVGRSWIPGPVLWRTSVASCAATGWRLGMSQGELGQQCYVSGSLVRMFELARRVPSRDFMARADEVLGTDTFVHMWRLVSRESHPSYSRPFAEFEQEATSLRLFQPLAVSGLLQTEDYARTVLRNTSPDATPEKIEELVNARMERQGILDRSVPPTLVVLLEERSPYATPRTRTAPS